MKPVMVSSLISQKLIKQNIEVSCLLRSVLYLLLIFSVTIYAQIRQVLTGALFFQTIVQQTAKKSDFLTPRVKFDPLNFTNSLSSNSHIFPPLFTFQLTQFSKLIIYTPANVNMYNVSSNKGIASNKIYCFVLFAGSEN